jgi:adenylosuccinate synthase
MKFDVVVGLQYGSEAKGLVCNALSMKRKYDACVSVNSCQSGHTFYDKKGRKVVNRQLPTSFANCKHIIIGPGALIKPHVLKEEVEMLEDMGYRIRKRLFIDHSATVIPDNASKFEKTLVKNIGSTGEGVGYAMQQRVMRTAKTVGNMKDFFNRFGTVTNVWTMYDDYRNVLLEGTQGFGLSLIHGQYPHVTSRDTSTGTLITGAGLPINKLRDVYGVMRTYPIRVGTVVKSSGPMYKELTWEKIAKRAGYDYDIAEKTTVTGRIRRVGEIDYHMLYKAIKLTGVNKLAITFMNYLDADLEKVDSRSKLLANKTAKEWLIRLTKYIQGTKTSIVYASTNKYKMIKLKK